jgi:hypothetical protein
MTDGVFSPDGNWMWTGDEWIPAPPKSEPEPAPESEGTSETEDNYSTDELPVQAESPIIEPVPPRPPMPAPMPAPMPVPAGLPPGMSSSSSTIHPMKNIMLQIPLKWRIFIVAILTGILLMLLGLIGPGWSLICVALFYGAVLFISRNHVPEKLTLLERLERWPLPKTTITIIVYSIFYFLLKINVI